MRYDKCCAWSGCGDGDKGRMGVELGSNLLRASSCSFRIHQLEMGELFLEVQR